MSVTFNGQSYFSSGPHTLHLGRFGRLLLGPYPQGGITVTTDFGVRERRMQVKGRLVGTSVAQLFTRFNAIRDVAEAGTKATLAWEGQSWADMRLVEFEATGPVDRGRACSIGYVATFLKMP